MTGKKMGVICTHERICRISQPPKDELEKQLELLLQRFGWGISIELMSEALLTIIKRFESGEIKPNTPLQFRLTVRAELQDKNNATVSR